MNTVRSLLILLIFSLATPVAFSVEAVYVLQIDGLGCPFCVYGIEKKLDGIQDIRNIEVDLKKAQVIVTMHNNAKLSNQQARQAVEDAGFILRSFSQRPLKQKDGS